MIKTLKGKTKTEEIHKRKIFTNFLLLYLMDKRFVLAENLVFEFSLKKLVNTIPQNFFKIFKFYAK